MPTTTLITASLEPRRFHAGLLTPEAREDDPDRTAATHRRFNIESADSMLVRESTNALLRERYGWRGYQAVSLPKNQTADRTTLTAIEDGTTIGTITVGLDGAAGMNCEQVFPEEVDQLRAQFGRICEFTKLAVDPGAGTQRVLAALFHVAYIVAHRLRGYDAVVMEVNPRHVRFYERMLGGKVFGEERLNLSVNAPAVLLVIDFRHVADQIAMYADAAAPSAHDRSLYSLAFTPREEQGIIDRCMAALTPASMVVN